MFVDGIVLAKLTIPLAPTFKRPLILLQPVKPAKLPFIKYKFILGMLYMLPFAAYMLGLPPFVLFHTVVLLLMSVEPLFIEPETDVEPFIAEPFVPTELLPDIVPEVPVVPTEPVVEDEPLFIEPFMLDDPETFPFIEELPTVAEPETNALLFVLFRFVYT